MSTTKMGELNVLHFETKNPVCTTFAYLKRIFTFCIFCLQFSSWQSNLQYPMTSSSAVVCLGFSVLSSPTMALSLDRSSWLDRRSLRWSRDDFAVASISWYLLALDPLIQHFCNKIWHLLKKCVHIPLPKRDRAKVTPDALDHSVTLTDDERCLKVLHHHVV